VEAKARVKAMSREKQVQIPEALFLDIAKYFLFGDTTQEEHIKKRLQEKIDAMERRKTYTQYKTAESADERERARRKYLDSVQMGANFRW
jgi:hypothetical protein